MYGEEREREREKEHGVVRMNLLVSPYKVIALLWRFLMKIYRFVCIRFQFFRSLSLFLSLALQYFLLTPSTPRTLLRISCHPRLSVRNFHFDIILSALDFPVSMCIYDIHPVCIHKYLLFIKHKTSQKCSFAT